MYVLQHTQKHMLPDGKDLGLAKGRKVSLSVSSLASSMTDGTDENGQHHRRTGPYMEGNMNLLATM